MEDYIISLEQEFHSYADSERAEKQKAYMRGQFDYYGLTSPIRREIQKPFLVKEYLPHKKEALMIIQELWKKPQREFQMFGLDLFYRYLKNLEEEDITLIEKLIINKSWWDTVDFLSYKLAGTYFKKFPAQRAKYVDKWINSDNIWLQRSAILFQLKYKDKMDTFLLSSILTELNGSKEFFINKAIGWILREYSRTDPEWVINFVKAHTLSNLSKKEALRLIK